MANLRSVGIGLLASLLVGVVGASVAMAKRPPKPPSEPPATPVTYHLVWLDGLGGYRTRALGVNDSGSVVGYASTSGYDDPRAFICTPPDSGMIRDLNLEPDVNVPSGWVLTTAIDIKNAGWIAGGMEETGTGISQVYALDYPTGTLWTLSCDDLNDVTDNGFVDRIWIADINENGVVLGGFNYADHGGRGCFVWNPSAEPPFDRPIVIHNLSYPEGPFEPPTTVSSPNSMNDDLTIVGRLKGDAQNGNWQAFRWHAPDDLLARAGDEIWPGEEEGLPAPELLPGEVHSFIGNISINNQGVVAASIRAKSVFRPARYQDGAWELLAGNDKGFCEAVNDFGQICGRLGTKKFQSEPQTGFVFDPLAGFWPLDDLVQAENEGDGHLWFDGQSISDSVQPQDMSDLPDATSHSWGIIVGYKRFWGEHWLDVWADGQNRYVGFVLIPQ
jgi:probable HAF family extracellular repeat protein